MSEKFYHLVNRLNANIVFMIDDDFRYLGKKELTLADFTKLNFYDRELILGELKTTGYTEFCRDLRSFLDEFTKIEPNDKYNNLLEVGDIVNYLDLNGHSELIGVAEELFETIETSINEHEDIRKILLHYGIGLQIPPNYKTIFQQLHEGTQRRSVRIYKDLPSLEEVNDDLVTRNITPSEFAIFIVDKVLGQQQNGVDFVTTELVSLSESRNIISIIFTSKPEGNPPAKDPKMLNDYYIIQVDKSDENAMDMLTKNLALCAYVELFNRLQEVYKVAISNALTLALSRKNNMVFLASMANEEGITAYEAISNWFHVAMQSSVSKEMFSTNSSLPQYQYIIGLTHFLREEFLSFEKDIDLESETTIQELNTFEVFDYDINKQHLPPAPGDIFKFNDNYLILVGQDCDFTVRGKNNVSRNAKHADLLNAEFNPKRIPEKITETSSEITFNYFREQSDETNHLGVLIVELEDQLSFDFSVLDLCTFSPDGLCAIDLNRPLDKDVERLLPTTWPRYFTDLQSHFKEVKELRDMYASDGKGLDFLKSNDFSSFDYTENISGEITFPTIQRICRIKNEFRNTLLKSYWEYRSRIGINTISLTESEKVDKINIHYGYAGQRYEIAENTPIELHIKKELKRSKNKDFTKLNSTLTMAGLKQRFPQLEVIKEPHLHLVSSRYTHPASQISFAKEKNDDEMVLRVTFPYPVNGTSKFLQQETFSITDFLNQRQKALVKNDPSQLYYVSEATPESKIPLFTNKKAVRLDIATLTRGIIVPNLGIKISLSNNSIDITEIISESSIEV